MKKIAMGLLMVLLMTGITLSVAAQEEDTMTSTQYNSIYYDYLQEYGLESEVDFYDYYMEHSSDVWEETDISQRVERIEDTSQKVWDFANLLSAEEEQALQQTAQNYLDNFSLDMVIVTIDDANSLSSMEYADDFYDYNGFGVSRDIAGSYYSNSGILLLLDMDNRMIYLSTTGYGITLYHDQDVNRIIDNAWEYLPDGQYYNGLQAGADTATNIARERMSSIGEMKNANFWSGDTIRVGGNVISGTVSLEKIGWAFLFGAIASGILLFILLMRHRKTLAPAHQAHTYLVRNEIAYGAAKDQFVRTYTNRVRRESSSSSGGGGGGGSSSHTSSSGSSHGGGGRSF